MEDDTQFHPRLGVCHIVKYAQTLITSSSSRKRVLVPLGSRRSRCIAVLLYASTTKHETAHVPSCALERAPIAGCLCSPHGMLLVGSDCRGSGQNRVVPQSCASSKNKMADTNIKIDVVQLLKSLLHYIHR